MFRADFGRPSAVSSLLARCLDPEALSGENQYRCDGCGRLTDAVRRLRLLRPPRHLVLSLGRFLFERGSGRCRKLLAPVCMAGRLQLPLADGGAATFRLYAAVVHAGASLDAGHYYCLARPADGGGDWWRLDDELVTRLGSDDDGASGSVSKATASPAKVPVNAEDGVRLLTPSAPESADAEVNTSSPRDTETSVDVPDGAVFHSASAQPRAVSARQPPALRLDGPTDAVYMLFYRRCADDGDDGADETAQLPASLREEIERDNCEYRRSASTGAVPRYGPRGPDGRPPPPAGCGGGGISQAGPGYVF